MSIRIPAGRLRTLITVGAALVVCVGAHAQAGGGGQAPGGGGQGRRGGGQFGGGQMTIRSVPADVLAGELNLTDLQKAKLDAISAQYTKDMTALRGEPGAAPNPDAREKMQSLNTETTDKMTAVLTTDQQAKLPDVLKSLGNYRAVGIQLGALSVLKLTSDQKTKIVALAEASTKERTAKMAELQAGGGQPDRTAMMQAFQDMQKATAAKLDAILTSNQKTALAAYNKEHPQQFGPNGRGGGGNRRPGGAAAGGNGPV